MRRLQRLNESHQCRGLVACNCLYNADLTPPLHKRSQAVACCVGVKRTLTLSAQWLKRKNHWMEAWGLLKYLHPGGRCSDLQMTRWQRPKETYQRVGLSLAGKDLFPQSIQALQDVLHQGLGAGVQRLDLIGERAVG